MRAATRAAARLSVRARAEDRGADAHHRRAFGDRRFEVVAHADRQRVERQAVAAQPSKQRAQRADAARAALEVAARGSGIAISPRRRSRGSAATARASAGASAGATPLLVASPLMLTCRQTCSGAQAPGRCAAQALGDLQPIDRMDPVEVLGDDARLVALQRADQVPLGRGAQVGSAAIFSSASCT